MNRAVTAGIVGLALLIGAGLVALLMRHDEEPATLKSVTLFFSCPNGTVLVNDDRIDSIALERVGNNAALSIDMSDDADKEFGALTMRSLGSLCHFYANGMLLASAIVRAPIFTGTMHVEVEDLAGAEDLVEAFEASRKED